MKKILLNISFCICLLFASLSFAASDPIAFLTSIADEMTSGLKSHQATLKTNPDVVYSLANRIMVPHADLDEMSRRVVPAQTWNGASAAEKSQFKKEFVIVLERTYGSALAEYKDQTIRFFPLRGGYEGKNSVKVDSQIVRSDGPAVNVSYKLVLRGSEWKVYDMSVEGVSMLSSFRSQFADKLSHENMAGLLSYLQQHNHS